MEICNDIYLTYVRIIGFSKCQFINNAPRFTRIAFIFMKAISLANFRSLFTALRQFLNTCQSLTSLEPIGFIFKTSLSCILCSNCGLLQGYLEVRTRFMQIGACLSTTLENYANREQRG